MMTDDDGCFEGKAKAVADGRQKTAGKNSRQKKRDLGWSLKKYPKKDKRGSI